jgi:hypothetical protein
MQRFEFFQPFFFLVVFSNHFHYFPSLCLLLLKGLLFSCCPT